MEYEGEDRDGWRLKIRSVGLKAKGEA